MARQVENLEMLLLILKWERTLLVDGSGSGNLNKVNQVVLQVEELTKIINNVNNFSNLAVRMQAMVVRSNYVRSKKEQKEVSAILDQELPDYNTEKLTFHEKLHLFELYSNYYHFLQNFKESYKYAQRWTELFAFNPHMMKPEVESYVNGLSMNLKNQVRLQLLQPLEDSIAEVEQNLSLVDITDALKLKLVKYSFTYRFHQFFLEGNFTKGARWFEENETRFTWAEQRLDAHSRMVMYYQLGSLYFGCDDYKTSLRWLNQVINMPGQDVHEDNLIFARILSLICHYELNNLDVIDYYIKSTFRLLLQKTDLYQYQVRVLLFLKKLNIDMTDEELFEAFSSLQKQLAPLVRDPYARRAFYYFDIISWLESKITEVPVEQVIRKKFIEKELGK